MYGKTIFIYADKGVGLQPFACTKKCMQELASGIYTVQMLSAAEVIEGTWVKEACLFVMPGGADKPYAAKLDGTGNKRIKEFVKNGGAYLGICAGAYYGCNNVVFSKGKSDAVEESRELGFFQGKAKGPVFGPYDVCSNASCRAVKLDCAGTEFETYYNGGCTFKPEKEFKQYTVLASYAEAKNNPAVVSLPYGAGRVVLSGVHFEYCADQLNTSDIHQSALKEVLQDNEKKRVAFINELADQLRLERNFRKQA